jgi:hypothetical protein
MHQNIHKQSLKITLLENRVKIKMLTKKLMSISIIICIALLVLSLSQKTKTVLFIAIPVSIYSIYVCTQIQSLWKIHKKIKQKLQTL